MCASQTISESFFNPGVEERVEVACTSEGNYFKMTKGTCIIVTFSECFFSVTHIMFLPEALLWCYSASTLNSNFRSKSYLSINRSDRVNKYSLPFFKTFVEIA